MSNSEEEGIGTHIVVEKTASGALEFKAIRNSLKEATDFGEEFIDKNNPKLKLYVFQLRTILKGVTGIEREDLGA